MDSKKQVLNFYRSFNCNPVILYVGQKASDEELKAHIANLPWSCVLTSRRDPAFGSLFSTETRGAKECCKKEEIPAKPINKQALSILRLFGIDGAEEETPEWMKQMFPDGDAKQREENSRDMFRILYSLLDCASQLVVIGYDPANPQELPIMDFCRTLGDARIPDGSVHIWGIDAAQESNRPLAVMAEHKHYELMEMTLSAALEQNGQTGENDTMMPDYSELKEDLFYCANEPIGISSDELVRFRHMATLLTDKTVNGVRPYGKAMYERWFFNFLNLSSTEGPQWYGYLPQSKFYVKRSFEDPLAVLVRKMLDGSIPLEKRGPVILDGPSGSSKSVTLAALAYRIFNESLCPVIFIKNDSFLFYNESEEMSKLEELMRLIDEKTEKKMRILLVWDCSSYRSVEANALRLTRQLQNKGFRFVLVCSAYSRAVENNQVTEYFKTDEPNKLFACPQEEAQIVKCRSCYYVNASREMTRREIVDLWTKISDYSGLDSTTIRYWKNKFEQQQETNIFQYFYRLIALLRPNLESGLSREEQKVWQYVEEQVREILGTTETKKQPTQMELALMKAGIDISKLAPAEQEASSELGEIDMEAFCLCIAMFSRFKLEVPYSIAFEILTGMSNVNTVYSMTHRKLFDIITKIPLVYYGESETGGDYAFRFRNAFEAQLFLERKDPSGEKQLKLILQIIKIYGEEYIYNGYEDDRFKKNLIDFLRLIGPNSEYYRNNETERDSDHVYILSKLDELIAQIDALEVPNKETGFAQMTVTFMREFYGKLWDGRCMDRSAKKWEICPEEFNAETYKMRILQLSKARELAGACSEALKDKIDDLSLRWENKQRLVDEKNSLAVETALINATVERLENEYKECCEANGIAPEAKFCTLHTEYLETFRQLEKVIYYNPLNGYAYNALFGAFEQMYAKESVAEEKKLQYLSEIMPLVDLGTNPDIINRGEREDELSKHIQRIYDYSNDYAITIDQIEARGTQENLSEAMEVYFKLYDALMEANNPAAILFVCQKELKNADVTTETVDVLTDAQVAVCEKVRRFMRCQENYECVSSNANAMALLVRVTWMYYNKRPLTGGRDRQMTYMDAKAWKEINGLCRTYTETAGSIGYQPVIILIYALSAIQVSKDYREASNILRMLSEERFFNLSRTRTPYMICKADGSGQPETFSGRVCAIQDQRKGSISIPEIPDQLFGGRRGVHFDRQNLGLNTMPEYNAVLNKIEIGLGYLGLTAYTEKGRKERGEQI